MDKYYCSSQLTGNCIIPNSIREHNDIVIALLNVMESFLLQYNFAHKKYHNDVCICVSRRSRVFIDYDQSVHCFAIPFNISYSSGEYFFNYYDEQLSFKEIGILKSLFLNNSIFTTIESFFDEFLSTMDIFSVKTQKEFDFYFSLFLFLLKFETGYIRFDHDIKGADLETHPENHFDIFFSKPASFKLGINNNVSIEEFIDILDPDSLCYYLDKKRFKSPRTM